MGYTWDITIPADTEESDPVVQRLELHPGIVTRIGVKFPAGCHGLVKVRLTRGGVFQVFPLSADEWVTGDDEEVVYTYFYDLTDRPISLEFVGISPGTTYAHTVTVRITVLPKAVASMMPLIEILTKALQRMGLVR